MVIFSAMSIGSGQNLSFIAGAVIPNSWPFFIFIKSTNNPVSGSLINSDSWEVGTGSVAGYNVNGGASENVREMGIGPYGNSVMLWKAVPDAARGADGGWNGVAFPIDSSKNYRLTVWIKKTGSTGGNTY